MKLIDGQDIIEHAEVNGESREFIRKLMDYIEDVDVVEPKTGDLISRDEFRPKALMKCYKCRWWNYNFGCQSKHGCDFEPYRKESE